MSDLTAKGMKTRRRVLGDAHVNRAEAGKTEADAPFQALITDAAWGHVWSREAISLLATPLARNCSISFSRSDSGSVR